VPGKSLLAIYEKKCCRLFGSLPGDVIRRLNEQREFELRGLKHTNVADRREVERKHFERYDERLDCCDFGPSWLQAQGVARIIAEEIHNLSFDRYRLITYCIMPNHVHILIESLVREQANHAGKSAQFPVTETLRLLKGRTARACNLELGRTGSFWQHESYDHVIRDHQELDQTILYVLNNPVKTGLVREWKDWMFTYVHPDFGNW
jgi:putative transposase